MKKITYYLLLIIAGIAIVSCAKDDEGITGTSNDDRFVFSVNENVVVQGLIHIKLTEESEKAITRSETADGIPQLGIEGIDRAAQELGAIKIERTFGHGGKFEARHRAEGLHLWYDIYYDDSNSVTRAYNVLSEIKGVDVIEPAYQIVSLHTNNIITREQAQELIAQKQQIQNADKPNYAPTSSFSDPYLNLQWHYQNDGSLGTAFTEGSDINLFPAWDITTGDPSVVVAVIDEGVDTTHPDLNMWVNPNYGSEDADYTYKGGINGWNFYTNTPAITPGSDHGTHVAGTIGAINNNGVGVAGIAGGNYAAGQEGVQIMSCQIFYGDYSASNKENAFVYAADNGAVIAQNSWSYKYGAVTTLPEVDQTAIDYFIKYAGIDETGTQVGPIEGGIVIFAAGNDNREYNAYPAAYEKVLAVAAMGPAFERASYSNYGTWVDVIAPGGNDPTFTIDIQQVYSTFRVSAGSYGYEQGTSMACPHVSGVAALLVSHYGINNKGISGNDIRMMIEKNTNDTYAYNTSSTYSGKLGSGYVDAYKALTNSIDNGTAPVNSSNIEFDSYNRRIDINITVTQNSSAIIPNRYQVFYATRDLSSENLDSPASDVATVNVRTESMANGDVVTQIISDLTADTKYYFAVRAWNVTGGSSSAMYYDATTANTNQPEDVTDFTVKWSNSVATATWSVAADPDDVKPDYYNLYYSTEDIRNQDWNNVDSSISVETVSMSRYAVSGSVSVKFRELEAGKGYYFVLVGHDARTNISTPAHALLFTGTNKAPTVSESGLPVLNFTSVGESKTLNLADYFSNDDPFDITYELSTTPDGNYLSYSVENNVMTITANELISGTGIYKIIATDYAGLTANALKEFTITNNSNGGNTSAGTVSMYPNPVSTTLTVDVSGYTSGTIEVNVYNLSGTKVRTVSATSGVLTVDMSALSSGTYTVKVKYGSSNVTRSITKL